jgi:hypothetical protein
VRSLLPLCSGNLEDIEPATIITQGLTINTRRKEAKL